MISRLKRNAGWFSEYQESLKRSPSIREEFSEKAETRVLGSLKSLGGEDWDVYHRVRVPMLDTIRGKGEIDLIAVGKRCLIAVEVKNWVGLIEEEDGEFFQKRVSRGRVLERHVEKVKSLERIYRGETNCNVPPIYSLIVFPNPRTVFSEGVSRMFSCLSSGDLDLFYHATVSKLEEMPDQTRAEFSRMFEDFGTWDTIELHGGLTLSGDVADGFAVCCDSSAIVDRNSISEVSFSAVRGEWPTKLLGPRVEAKLLFRDGSSMLCHVDPFQSLDFLAAGKGKIPMGPSKIRKITFGHMGLEKWRKERSRISGSKVNKATRKYSEGDVVIGTVQGWVESGILVELDKSGCLGLLRNRAFSSMSEIQISRAFYTKGREIEVEVSETDKTRGILLDFLG